MLIARIYKVLRTVLVILLVLPLAVPALLYVTLSVPSVQSYIGRMAENELTALLGTKVKIDRVDYSPFTRIVLRDVTVNDSTGQIALHVGHLGAGLSISESLWNNRPVVTYAELIDMDLHLWRDSTDSPLNIAPIIRRFKKDDSSVSSAFDIAVNMVVIRRSSVSYDILSAPVRDKGKWDPAHINVHGLRADLHAPRISNGLIEIDIKRMAAYETSGLALTSLSASLKADLKASSIDNLAIQMPNSAIAFDSIRINASPLSKEFDLHGISTKIATLPGSHISAADLSPLLPIADDLSLTADLDIEAEANADEIDLKRLAVSIRDYDTWVDLNGSAYGIYGDKGGISIDLRQIRAKFNAMALLRLAGTHINNATDITGMLKPLGALGDITLLGQLSAAHNTMDFSGAIASSCGNIDIDAGIYRHSPASPIEIDGRIAAMNVNFSGLDESLAQFSDIYLDASADLAISRSGAIDGTADVDMSEAIWKGVRYNNIHGSATFAGEHVDVSLNSHAPAADMTLLGGFDRKGSNPLSELYADIRYLSLSNIVDNGPYKDYHLSAEIDASVHGRDIDRIDGWLQIKDFHLADESEEHRIDLDEIQLTSTASGEDHTLSLRGGPLDMNITGRYSYPGLASDMKLLVAKVFPSLLPDADASGRVKSNAEMVLTVNPDTIISRFLKLPVEVIYPMQLKANADSSENTAKLILNAPYLKQKDKLIENTSLTAGIDGNDSTCHLGFGTIVPTKNGPMDLRVNASGVSDSILTAISWHIDCENDYLGDISFSSAFSRNDDSKLLTDISIAPGKVVFNDSVWNVTPGSMAIRPGSINIKDFGATRSGQTLAINGIAETDTINRLEVTLDHIDLDYIFETLDISDAVSFGGIATGRLFGERLLSDDPILYTPRLYVEGLSYNHCEFGDGDIRSLWDNGNKAIIINADLKQPDGRHSSIQGSIMPLTEQLDFNFTADEAPAGFMLPFMSAFTSSIDGKISGNAHLFGTFKDLDIVGDVYVKDLKMKLDFTNTVYSVSDSVHITPGLITFNDVTLSDRDGNTAKLSGKVTHKYFHDPTFRFDITDASNLLVYDVGEHDTEDPWYGRIYGYGSAAVTGVPGKIDIGVKMRTGAKSTFTFVISDAEQSVEYDFITLRDRDKDKKDSIAALDPTPMIVKQLRERIKQQEEGAPSVYAMNFTVDISPEATLNLIMDPVGGDKITAHGNGSLRMGYASDGELNMYGEYTLSQGSYNFTLQDIILKDFTILEGSKISFLGDPYAAQLNIRASYTLNANLSDLDESFLEDRELTRTNVKVNAIMIVTGDMRQPDIKFDLEFPTLTADTYRKVRSIISTDEMMSRQIIYLLALNRFYTPEYMSTTHGNELVSVASSTLSSRLGSMLGQLSDNWSIAPAIRSDRGDFSDVEVDVALSSQLLDNRLLFNGNLGYRDKSLNNNSFIGDFDIRYLLNRAGTIQLKAYNRYNDQNFYFKSALTTQGVGIVFKRDFDNIFSFLKPLRKKKQSVPTDTLSTHPAEPSDSIK